MVPCQLLEPAGNCIAMTNTQLSLLRPEKRMGLGKGLEHQKQLSEVEGKNLEKRRLGGALVALYSSLTGGSRQQGVGHFSHVTSDRTR